MNFVTAVGAFVLPKLFDGIFGSGVDTVDDSQVIESLRRQAVVSDQRSAEQRAMLETLIDETKKLRETTDNRIAEAIAESNGNKEEAKRQRAIREEAEAKLCESLAEAARLVRRMRDERVAGFRALLSQASASGSKAIALENRLADLVSDSRLAANAKTPCERENLATAIASTAAELQETHATAERTFDEIDRAVRVLIVRET